MNATIDLHIDHLESLVCERIRTLTGYATDHINVRTLAHQLKYSDKTDCGLITPYHFNEFLVRMNIVGVRDIDMLFNRYDEDFNGFMDYREFAHSIFGSGPMKRLTGSALENFHSFRQNVVKKQGLGFLLQFIQVLSSSAAASAYNVTLERDKDGFSSISSLIGALSALLPPNGHGSLTRSRIGGINRSDLHTLLQNHFDVHGNGKVNLSVFVKRFKSGMSSSRKKLIRAVFDNLDVDGKGYISKALIEENYRADGRIDSKYVGQQGFLQNGCLVQDLCTHMQLVEALRNSGSRSNSLAISWPAFLDYYRCLSMGIEDDYSFDMIVRQSWSLVRALSTPSLSASRGVSAQRRSPDNVASPFSPTSSTAELLSWKQSSARSPGSIRRRLLVTHNSGKEEVVEIVDEIGRTKLDEASLFGTLNSMGWSDISDIKW